MLKSIPKLNDPRWQILIFLSSYSIYALTSESFTRNSTVLFVCIFSAIIIDALLSLISYKKLFFPLSSVISGFGIFLLCESPYLWIYFLVVLLSLATKHCIKINGKHIYNPTNIGIGLVLFFGGNYLTLTAGNWGGSLIATLIILLSGIILTYRANRTAIVFSFFITFFSLAIFRSIYLNVKLIYLLAPITGPSFILFIFYMLTDPKVVPNNILEQTKMGILIGIIDCILRLNEQKYALLYSLIIMLSFYPSLKFYKLIFKEDQSEVMS